MNFENGVEDVHEVLEFYQVNLSFRMSLEQHQLKMLLAQLVACYMNCCDCRMNNSIRISYQGLD